MRTASVLTMFLLLAAPRGASQDPAATELLAKVNEYLTAHIPKASGVSLDERYTLGQVSGGGSSAPLRIGSEIVFVNVNGRLYSFRDVATVDGARTRDPKVSRLIPLLAQPTQASWNEAQIVAQQSFKYFGSELVVLLHDPALALHFVQPPQQAKFTYKIDGRKKINNVEAAALRFDEIRGDANTKYLMGTRGNGASSGRLWIDPATGAIHQTEYWLDSETEGVRVNITYAMNSQVNMLLPSKMAANYDMRPASANRINRGEGGYGARMTYQINADYSNARYTPVDLTKMTR